MIDTVSAAKFDTNGVFDTLILGEMDRWRESGKILPEIPGLVFIEFDSLTRKTLATLKPTLILSPMLTTTFDVLDVATRLNSIGFVGRYRAVADPMPNLHLIYLEVNAVAPDLDFDIIPLPSILPEQFFKSP